MRSHVSLACLALSAIALLPACGKDEQLVGAEADVSSARPSETSVTRPVGPPPTGQPEGALEFGDPREDPSYSADPYALLAVNDNRTDSQIGATCWFRWEIARSLMISHLGTPTDKFRDSVDSSADLEALTSVSLAARMSEALDSPARSRLATSDREDVGLEQFAAALISAAEALAADKEDSWAVVDFEAMPGFESYGRVAQTSPDCTTP